MGQFKRQVTDGRSGLRSHGRERTTEGQRSRHLFDCWAQVSERIRSAEQLALFLDFDGTLAPFRLRPEAVYLSHSTRRALRFLVRHPQVRVFVLSGRRRADVEDRVGVPGLRYLGLHGWEGLTATAPKASARRFLRRAKRQLQDNLAGLRGVWIEEKGPIFAVHVRGAGPRAVRRTSATVRRVMRRFGPDLRVLAGNQVWEVVPRELEGKGVAVRSLLCEMPTATLPIYVGDDTTDESAFAVLRQGITVCVGVRQRTKARFDLRGPQEVRRFLQKLERVLREPRVFQTTLRSGC